MKETVAYLVESTTRLNELVGPDPDPDLVEPTIWLADEGDGWPVSARIAKVKLLFLQWIETQVEDTFTYLPRDAKWSIGTFDEFWSIRRIDVNGTVQDLVKEVGTYPVRHPEPTGITQVDEWFASRRA
jgi:hypothetical protein